MDSHAAVGLRCATHPDVETVLRCGKCDRPICPRCVVMTPVGARCRGCAQLRRSPVYDISPLYYLRAAGAGVGLALGSALLLTYFGSAVRFFTFFLLLGAGYIIGEGVSAAANRKRGRGLQVIAGASVVLAFIGRAVVPIALQSPAALLSPGLLVQVGFASALALVANPLALLMLAAAAWVAISRV